MFLKNLRRRLECLVIWLVPFLRSAKESSLPISEEDREVGFFLARELQEMFQLTAGMHTTTVRFSNERSSFRAGKAPLYRQLILEIDSPTGTYKSIDDAAKSFLESQVLPDTALVHLVIHCKKEMP